MPMAYYNDYLWTCLVIILQTPQNYGRIEVGPGAHESCHISEMVQDRTEVTITD